MTDKKTRKFAFIVHCRNTKELRLVLARYRFSPCSLLPEKKLKAYCLGNELIEDIFTFKQVISDRNTICQGKAYCMIMSPDLMLENQVVATERAIKAAKMAEAWGAEMIGLGAICAVIGARGVEIADHCSSAVTTGNSLTVHASIYQFETIMQQMNINPLDQKIAVIGFPGSIGLAITRILHQKGMNLLLVSRRKTAFMKRFLDEMKAGKGTIDITQDISSAIARSKIIFTTTSTGQIIDQNTLSPGSIVFDIAQPKDVIYKTPPRKDVLILDTGLISLPGSTKDTYRYSGLGPNDIPSCLGETMTLTFEEKWENFSMGRELYLDKISEIGKLAEKHGFIFDDFRSFQKPVSKENIETTRNAFKR